MKNLYQERYVVYKVNAERMEENVENTKVYFYEGWVLAPAGLGARERTLGLVRLGKVRF